MPPPNPKRQPSNADPAAQPGGEPAGGATSPQSTPNFAAMGSRERASVSGQSSGLSFSVGSELPKVPGYDILAEVGRGNMGVIYKAKQHRLNRIVALKMIIAGKHADPQQQRRFLTEAEAVARLQHPNIVQVYDIGELEDQPYLVMEFVDGGSLDRRLRGRRLSPKAAAQLIMTLAKAIQAAHEAGIIHRDLKPGNILVTARGIPKVTDFGLAKKMDADTSATASGTILGTPSYMAPEQARSNKLPTTPATDVYGLGAILYELLTGRPPFKEETFLDTMLQVVSAPPVPPSRLNEAVPEALEAICLKCLAKDPTERYMTARQLADALAHFLTATSSATGQSGRLLEQPIRLPEPLGDEDDEGEVVDLASRPGSSIVYPSQEIKIGSLPRQYPLTSALAALALLVVGLGLSAAILGSKGQAFALVALPLGLALPFLSPTPIGIGLGVVLSGGAIAGSFALNSPYPLLVPGLIGLALGGLSRLIAWLTDRLTIHCMLGAFAGLLVGFLALWLAFKVNVLSLQTWQSSTYLIQMVAVSTGAILLGSFFATMVTPKQGL